MWRATVCPRLAGANIGSGPDGAKRYGIRRVGTHAGKLTNLGEPQKIAYRRLSSAIFICSVGMQSVAATAGLGINKCNREVVAAQEPRKSPGCFGLPFGIVFRAQGLQAGGDGCGCFHRLLVERVKIGRASCRERV